MSIDDEWFEATKRIFNQKRKVAQKELEYIYNI